MTWTDTALFLVAAALGAMVGAVELFQRYKAEPLKALATNWGLGYAGFNGFVSLIAYFVYSLAASGDETTLEKISYAALCGLGAAAVLRAKIMNVQTSEGKEVALGPEIVIQTFLKVIDRELDRRRAKERFQTVRKVMHNIDFEKAKVRLPIQIFQAMQGVSEEESERLMANIGDVDTMVGLSSQDKSYLLGFYLLDLVGEKFLTDLFEKYKAEFTRDLALQPAEPGDPAATPDKIPPPNTAP